MSTNQPKSNESKNPEVVLPLDAKSPLYKTELCKKFMEYGFCKYGDKCQFAHGKEQLRQTQKHPKYKTEKCKSFWATGSCRYGTRCKFLHDEQFDANGQIIEKDPYQYSSPSRPVTVQPRMPFQESYYQDYKYPPPMYNNPNSYKPSPLPQMPQTPLIVPAFYPNPNNIYDTLTNQQQQQQSSIQQAQSPPLGLLPEQYNSYEQQLYEMNYEMYQQQADIDPTKLLSPSPQPDMTWEELQQTSQTSLLSANSCKSPSSSVSPALSSNNNNNNNNIMSPSPPLPSSSTTSTNTNNNNNNNNSSQHPPLIPGRKYGITKDTLHNYGYQTSGSCETRKSSWGPDTMLTSEEMVGVNRKRTWPMRSIREDDQLIEDMENMSLNNPASSGDEMMMYMDDGSRYNPITGTRLPVFLKLGADSPPPPPVPHIPVGSIQSLPPPPPSQQQQSQQQQSTQSYSIPIVIQSPSASNSVINSAVSSPSKSGNNNNSGNSGNSSVSGDSQNSNNQQQSYPLF